jgi:lysophospholipase L1-like esterase
MAGQATPLRIVAQAGFDAGRALVAVVALLRAVRGPVGAELWVGDSHAVCFNQRLTAATLTRAPEGQVVWHLGPRLMHSLARQGFPSSLRRLARVVHRVGRPGAVVPVFVAGEIDVRCHLVPRATSEGFSLGFAADYVRQGCELAQLMGSSRAVFVVPPPPSVACPVLPDFPIRGSIEERVAMFGALRAALAEAVDGYAGPVEALLLDATDALADEDAGLRQDLTDDGCHTNALGVRLVRDRLRELAPLVGEGP